MEEETTWKSHSFTLLVFAGIVVLCSIFFILGMLVGRVQGQKLATASLSERPSKVDAKPAPKEDGSAFTFYDSVKKEDPPALHPSTPQPESQPAAADPPKKPDFQPAPADPLKKAESALEPPPSNLGNYQVGALRKQVDAERLLKELKKKGFRAFILMPPPDDANPFFRVQVGPLRDAVEAQTVKKALEAERYQFMLKK